MGIFLSARHYKMTKIDTILFDMDGVLIDARDWHYEALNKALSLFGMAISRLDHLNNFDGLPTREKLKLLTIERNFPEQLHAFVNELKQKYTLEIVHQNCHPTFQHEYALSQLKLSSVKLGLCSNSVRRSVELMTERANIDKYFDLVLSNEDVTNSKPDPEIYLTAMSKLDTQPEHTLIVEDNENGIKAAVASGAHVMRVLSPYDVTFANIKQHLRQLTEPKTEQ